MRRSVKIAVLLMTLLTAIYVGAVAYVNSSSNGDAYSNGHGKDPIEYGIWRSYFAEKMGWEPQEWNTTEELGIMLIESTVVEERYHIFIADEEKALLWMNDTELTPYALKYDGKFYRISWLSVTPGLPEYGLEVYLRNWQISVGTILGIGWICTGVLSFKRFHCAS